MQLTSSFRGLVMASPLVSDFLRSYWKFSARLMACRGVYYSYDEAKRAGATFTTTHYNPRLFTAPESLDETSNMRRRDYPVLFWLAQSIKEGTKILNLGGNAGSEYFTYRQFMHFPTQLHWLVWELPPIVEFGESLKQIVDAPELAFTSRLEDGEGADVILTCGALQYFEEGIADTLKRFKKLPSQVFINRVPLYNGATFYTLQSVVGSVVPYRIQNREELVDSMTALGYRLVDSWYEDREILIPFHRERSVRCFHGFYFSMDHHEDEPEWRLNAIATGHRVRSKVATSGLFYARSPRVPAT